MGQTLFRDARGVQWRVYEVSARTLARLPARRAVLPALRGGWLCFEAAREKRRLTSYPADWSALYDAGLAALCEAATVVRPVPLRARPPASAA